MIADSHAVNPTAGTARSPNVEGESRAPSYMTAKGKGATWGSTKDEGASNEERRMGERRYVRAPSPFSW